MKRIFILLVLLTGPLLKAQSIDIEEVKSLKDYQDILETVRSESRMLLVIISNDENELLEDIGGADIQVNPDVITALKDYKVVSTDITSEMALAWIELFPLGELPTYYYLNSDEILLLVKSGKLKAEDVVSGAMEARKAMDLYSSLAQKYSNHKLTENEWRQLLDLHALNFPFHQTQSIAMEFFNSLTEEKLWTKANYPYLTLYGISLETPYPTVIIKKKETISKTFPAFDFQEFYGEVYSYNLDKAIISEDSVILNKLVSGIMPHNPDTSVNSRDMIFETQRLYAEETRQFNIWAKAALKYYEDIDSDSLRAEALFEEAFALADNFESKSSKKAARKLAAEANEINENFRYRMLEAFMAYQLKDFAQAEQLVIKARSLTTNPVNHRKAEGLLGMIERAKN